MLRNSQQVFRGLSLSDGIAIGDVFFLTLREAVIPKFRIAKHDIQDEIKRFREAITKSEKDIKQLRKVLADQSPAEVVDILNSHLEMLHDPLLTSEIEKKIYRECRNVESVFQDAIAEFKVRFSSLEDGFFQERIRDIVDVSKRVLRHLKPTSTKKMDTIPKGSIVVTKELIPSDVAESSTSNLLGLITQNGGSASHVAIIARAKGIPYVADIDIEQMKRLQLGKVIIDGFKGEIIINPTQKTLQKYQELKEEKLSFHRFVYSRSKLKTQTRDGHKIHVFGNIEVLSDVDTLLKYDSSGVGLFRSEYLFLTKSSFPSEEDQFNLYRKIVQKLGSLPVILRVFDVGGEKYSSIFYNESKPLRLLYNEVNPVLGCRAIRFLLRNEDLLEKQLRAILRASVFGNVQILIPMISDIEEIRTVKRKIQKIKKQLAQENVKVAEKIPLGCMIEVPSAVIMCDTIAQEVDFLSIGTNDLVQYVLAADRTNPHMNYLYSPVHPSVIRLILMVVSSAKKFNIPLILCGEAAADPKFIPLLLGLGIEEFSVAVRHIPLIKHTIRKTKMAESKAIAQKALKFKSGRKLSQFILNEYQKNTMLKIQTAAAQK